MEVVTTRADGSLRVQTVNEEPEMTRQSFRDECDINFILRDLGPSGVIRHLNEAEALYADVSELTGYDDALCIVKAAELEFGKLPAKVREVFDHSPAKFLDAAHDPGKRELLEKAGLIPAARPEDAVKPATEVPAVPASE